MPHVVENSRFTRRLFMNTLLEATQISPVHPGCCAWLCGKSVGLLSLDLRLTEGRPKLSLTKMRDFRASCIRNSFSFCVIINIYIYILYIINPAFHEK